MCSKRAETRSTQMFDNNVFKKNNIRKHQIRLNVRLNVQLNLLVWTFTCKQDYIYEFNDIVHFEVHKSKVSPVTL